MEVYTLYVDTLYFIFPFDRHFDFRIMKLQTEVTLFEFILDTVVGVASPTQEDI